MVPDVMMETIKEPTGARRVRLVKRWYGIQVIVEEERVVEWQRRNPYAPVLRTECRWFRVKPWNYLGQNFYSRSGIGKGDVAERFISPEEQEILSWLHKPPAVSQSMIETTFTPFPDASTEPLLIIERNECLSDIGSLATKRFQACFNEIHRLTALLEEALKPIQMVITCPMCKARHIDEGEFATKPHHTHACQSCGMPWRPAIQATVGVQFLPGFKNEPPCEP